MDKEFFKEQVEQALGDGYTVTFTEDNQVCVDTEDGNSLKFNWNPILVQFTGPFIDQLKCVLKLANASAKGAYEVGDIRCMLLHEDVFKKRFGNCAFRRVATDIVMVACITQGVPEIEGSAQNAILRCLPEMEGKTEDEVWDTITANTLAAHQIKLMNNTLAGIVELDSIPEGINQIQLFIVTNDNQFNGAVNALCSGILDIFAEKNDCDLVVFPSSVHECMLMRYSEGVVNIATNVVRSKNSELDARDVLSDYAYLYKKDTKELIAIDGD